MNDTEISWEWCYDHPGSAVIMIRALIEVVEVARKECDRVDLVEWQTYSGEVPSDVEDIVKPIRVALDKYDKLKKR